MFETSVVLLWLLFFPCCFFGCFVVVVVDEFEVLAKVVCEKLLESECKWASWLLFVFVSQSEPSLLTVTGVLIELLVRQTNTCCQHHLLTHQPLHTYFTFR